MTSPVPAAVVSNYAGVPSSAQLRKCVAARDRPDPFNRLPTWRQLVLKGAIPGLLLSRPESPSPDKVVNSAATKANVWAYQPHLHRETSYPI